jgi:LPPG:FO 2-phospho-L-lactate transferase
MTDAWVPTRILTDVGLIHFEEYMVKRQCQDTVEDVIFDGIDQAAPAPGVLDAIEAASILIVCPSNPIVSIGPILTVPGIRDAVKKSKAPCVAISPIVGGKPVKGPADKLMVGKDVEVSAKGVAELYQDFLDVLVIDQIDEQFKSAIEVLEIHVILENTMMTSLDRKRRLARTVLDAATQVKKSS